MCMKIPATTRQHRNLSRIPIRCLGTSTLTAPTGDVYKRQQIGREDTPEQYIDRLVEVFRELRRVLKDDGTFWLNIADTYCGSGMKAGCKHCLLYTSAS